jgi:hypothetical protein
MLTRRLPRGAAPGARLLVALAALLLASACGATAGPEAAAPPASTDAPATGVQRFFPTQGDLVYAYETIFEDTGERGVLMLRTSRPREGRVDLTSGGEVQRLALTASGIEFVEGGWLLKAPLTAGATWRGRLGSVRLERTDQVVQVPAGTFTGCIVTIEEASAASGARRITSTFCPDVGLVGLDVEAVTDDGLVRESARLRSFGPRVDLGAFPAEAPPP